MAAAENEPTSQKRCFPLPMEWAAEDSSSPGPNQLSQENHPCCTHSTVVGSEQLKTTLACKYVCAL